MPTRTKHLAKDSLTLDDDTVGEFVEFLESRLGAEDFSKLKEMLARCRQSEDGEEETDETPTMDSPAPFKGMPKPGGTMVAADSAHDRFAKMFPEVVRIKVLG